MYEENDGGMPKRQGASLKVFLLHKTGIIWAWGRDRDRHRDRNRDRDRDIK